MEKTEILKRYFGHSEFRPGQGEVIDHILSGQDCLGVMPTGAGKSMCYQIPALMLGGTTIVISPLISLMKDQVEGLQQSGVSAACINSSLSTAEYFSVLDRASAGEYSIIYVAPERLSTENFLEMCRNITIPLVAVDEAHCVSHWGQDFRPSYLKIAEFVQSLPKRPVLAAFTATATDIVKRDIVKILGLFQPFAVTTGFDRANLYFEVRPTEQKHKDGVLLGIVRELNGRSGIVYCSTRKNVEAVCAFLRLNGVNARCYHAGLPDDERRAAQEDFIYDRCSVMVATNAFGMGIDKSNVRWVIHYNLPKSIESFYQEIGRAGRDGLPSDTLLFYSLADLILLTKFATESGQQGINLEKLQRMQQYAEADVCRRRILLSYFGEATTEDCGNCDVCKNPPQRFDGTVIVQKALSAIVRTEQQIGTSILVDILRGNNTPDVSEKGYQQLKTFGAGREVPARDWQDYLLQMLQLGYFEIAYNENNHLKITNSGSDVLFGRSQARLAVIRREESAPAKGRKKKPTIPVRELVTEHRK